MAGECVECQVCGASAAVRCNVEGSRERWNVCTVKILCLGCWDVCVREFITYSRVPLIWQPLDQTSNIPVYHTVPALT
jgi:hypothetical protein